MKTKKCLYCNDEITGKRNDAKFCSNTHKAKYWEAKKLLNKAPLPVQEKNVANQLRGVLNGDNANVVSETIKAPEQIFKTMEVTELNPARLPFDIEYRRLTDVRKRLDSDVRLLQANLKQVTSSNGNGWVVGLTTAGAFVGNNSTEKKTQGTFLGAAIGLFTGMIIQDATKNSREEDKKRQAEKTRKEIQSRLTLIQDNEKALKILKDKLQVIPNYHIVQKQIPLIPKNAIEGNNSLGLFASCTKAIKPLYGLQKDIFEVSLPTINSDKIISSQHLKKMEFKALNFQGKWNTLFGFPSTDFHCVIHGMSGEGKSTFAIQFAKCLADGFGRVIYISGEEGFSKTFKDKFSNNNAESKFLDVADLRTYDDIIKEVPPESYNFIFIDSLNNMKIDADKMKKIREWYKNSALITISQSTKDGKMRGSYEIVHDSDIAVKVENGIATTTKNRFKEKEMTLAVFEKKNTDVRTDYRPL